MDDQNKPQWIHARYELPKHLLELWKQVVSKEISQTEHSKDKDEDPGCSPVETKTDADAAIGKNSSHL